MEIILSVVNVVRENKGLEPLTKLEEQLDLRSDLDLDSLDLAELTVRLEKETGVDVFADSFVFTVADILKKITK
jgi:acyl carrier protein